MLKRLQDSKSQYDVEEWQKERLKKLQIVGRITKYEMSMVNKKDFKAIPGNFKPRMSFETASRFEKLAPGSFDLLQKLPKVKSKALTSQINQII